MKTCRCIALLITWIIRTQTSRIISLSIWGTRSMSVFNSPIVDSFVLKTNSPLENSLAWGLRLVLPGWMLWFSEVTRHPPPPRNHCVVRVKFADYINSFSFTFLFVSCYSLVFIEWNLIQLNHWRKVISITRIVYCFFERKTFEI